MVIDLDTIKNSIEFIEPWGPVESEDHLEIELEQELGVGHILFGKEPFAIARRFDCDDVLFVFPNEHNLAVVHLTWTGHRETDPLLPRTTFYPSIDEWKEQCMIPDSREFGEN